MQEADYSMTKMAMEESGNYGPQPGDEAVHAKFYFHPHKDDRKSAEEGRPIYVDREYIRIMIPGDKDSIVDRLARDADRIRFPRQYEAFKRGESEASIGTPLSAWPAISRSQVEELAFFGVKTVEHLASMPDSVAQKFMGANTLKAKAKAFLEAAAGEAPLTRMQAELEQRDDIIATMQKQISDLQKRLDEEDEE